MKIAQRMHKPAPAKARESEAGDRTLSKERWFPAGGSRAVGGAGKPSGL